MLNRKCPECSESTLKIPFFKSDFICSNCFSRFVQPSWFKFLEVFTGALLGSLLIYVLIFNPSWALAVFIFFLLALALDLFIKFYGPVKLTGLKAIRRKSAS